MSSLEMLSIGCIAKNQITRGKTDSFKSFRKHLLEELEQAFPDEVETYREIRASSAAERDPSVCFSKQTEVVHIRSCVYGGGEEEVWQWTAWKENWLKGVYSWLSRYVVLVGFTLNLPLIHGSVRNILSACLRNGCIHLDPQTLP